MTRWQVAKLAIKPNGDTPAAAAGGRSGEGTDPSADEGVTEAEISLMRKILRTKLIQSKNNVEIMRSDPNSPLYSIKSFEELRL